MSITRSRIELKIKEVKFRGNGSARDWYASAHVVATDLGGRKAQGWVHVAKCGQSLKIDHFDAYDEVDPELLRFVVATQGEAILGAVRAWAEDLAA
ncbi:MAG: hypothetical protein A3G26_11285 [Betaproteobacteria bacterium RIFCSPLOWO2_12_FULL_65_110]|nr:MAG: hypothetical protein A3G26_11285 [Betaproteobacteria bacterium RIFCSPLOWO2_12_FULL_65_110]